MVAEPGSKNVPSAVARFGGAQGALTPAGRIAEAFAAVRLTGLPVSPSSAPAKGAAAQARAAQQHAVRGSHYARDGRYEQAITHLRKAIELDSSVAAIHHDLGVVYLTLERFEDALAAFRRATERAPDLISAHRHLAYVSEVLERDEEACFALAAVVRLEPSDHLSCARLAQIWLRRSHTEEAVAWFRKAAATAGPPRAAILLAHADMASGLMHAAEARLRDLIAAEPLLGEAFVALGQVLSETGRAEEAVTTLERGITLDPDMAAAWQTLATNKKFTKDDLELIGRMLDAVARPGVAPGQRQAVHFALGKAYDDIGDYTAATRHFDAGNALSGTHRRLDRTRLAKQTDLMIRSSPPGFLARRSDLGVADETPILIVGMPRSGTTLVEQILSSHPDVAPGGELGFWRQRANGGIGILGVDTKPEVAGRLAQDYLAVLRTIAPDAPRVTDKMPFNFAHLGLIRQVFPQAMIVHCRRHPIDTCLSNYNTNFTAGFDFAADRDSLVFFYREYLRLMAHWRAVLPAERFYEVDYEALVADPEPGTRALVAACGLAWDDACLAPHLNQRQIKTASVWQARQPIYRSSVERWRRYEPWLGPLRALLDDVSVPGSGAV